MFIKEKKKTFHLKQIFIILTKYNADGKQTLHTFYMKNVVLNFTVKHEF